MRNKIRVVIDTNVVISAVLLPHAVSRQLLDLVIQQGTLLASEQTLAETRNTTRFRTDTSGIK